MLTARGVLAAHPITKWTHENSECDEYTSSEILKPAPFESLKQSDFSSAPPKLVVNRRVGDSFGDHSLNSRGKDKHNLADVAEAEGASGTSTDSVQDRVDQKMLVYHHGSPFARHLEPRSTAKVRVYFTL